MAPKLQILSLVNHSHSPSADGFEDAVVRECSALKERRTGLIFIRGQSPGHNSNGGGVQKGLRPGSVPEQGINFKKEALIFATRFVEKGIAPVLWQICGGVEKVLDCLPPLRPHDDLRR